MTSDGGASRAVRAARDLLAEFDACRAAPVPLDAIATKLEAYPIYGVTCGADAQVAGDGRVAYLLLPREQEGTERARFSIAHELAHLILHRGLDALAHVHAPGKKTPEERAIEDEADRFASELLVPRAPLARLASITSPRFDDVAIAARLFDASLTATMKAWTEVSAAPCACVVTRGTQIVELARSRTFRGAATLFHHVKRDDRWGARAAGIAIREEAVAMEESGRVLAWLTHAG